MRRDRKIKRSAEKTSKVVKSSKSHNDVGSFPLPADEIPSSGAGGPGQDLDGSLVEDSPPISKSPVRKSKSSSKGGTGVSEDSAQSPSASPNKSREEIQAIDARIASLQEYLDNARTGLLSSAEQG